MIPPIATMSAATLIHRGWESSDGSGFPDSVPAAGGAAGGEPGARCSGAAGGNCGSSGIERVGSAGKAELCAGEERPQQLAGSGLWTIGPGIEICDGFLVFGVVGQPAEDMPESQSRAFP